MGQIPFTVLLHAATFSRFFRSLLGWRFGTFLDFWGCLISLGRAMDFQGVLSPLVYAEDYIFICIYKGVLKCARDEPLPYGIMGVPRAIDSFRKENLFQNNNTTVIRRK